MPSPDVQFAEQDQHAAMVRLLRSKVPSGQVVLDLGCGQGQVAEPLADLGYEYLGCDVDPLPLASLKERGFETHRIDLSEVEELVQRLLDVLSGRRVGAVLLLNVLEYLTGLEPFMAQLRVAATRLDTSFLGLIVRNAGRFDVGAKLLFGPWNGIETALLDERQVQFFTERQLMAVLRRSGWAEAARDDLLVDDARNLLEPDHPAVAASSPLGNLLWRLRVRIGNGAAVNRFVRLFTVASADVLPAQESESPGDGPFLSVLVRTQGARMDNLIEALTCLAAQTDEDLHVHVMVHSSRRDSFQDVRRLVAQFAEDFTSRVSLHQVAEGHRGVPLNVGLAAARGRYVAFLDDDDFVTADWAERFRRGADKHAGAVVRSVAVDRRVARTSDLKLLAPYESLTGLVATHSPTFSMLEHLSVNRTPICSFAVPMEAVRSLAVRFDEDVPVLEDWRFLLEVALVCGVHDTAMVTSVYQRWEGGDPRTGEMDVARWDAAHRSIMQHLDDGPLLLPAGSATQIRRMWERSDLVGHEKVAENHGPGEMEERLTETLARVTALEEAQRVLLEERRELEYQLALARDAIGLPDPKTWRLSARRRRLASVLRQASTYALRRRGQR